MQTAKPWGSQATREGRGGVREEKNWRKLRGNQEERGRTCTGTCGKVSVNMFLTPMDNWICGKRKCRGIREDPESSAAPVLTKSLINLKTAWKWLEQMFCICLCIINSLICVLEWDKENLITDCVWKTAIFWLEERGKKWGVWSVITCNYFPWLCGWSLTCDCHMPAHMQPLFVQSLKVKQLLMETRAIQLSSPQSAC